MLSCYLTRRRLGAYLDGALAERAARSAATHLTGCASCRHEIDQLRRLQALLQRAALTPEPTDWAGFWPGVVRGIESGRRGETPAWSWRAFARPWSSFPRWAYGGAVAAALGLSLTIWQLTASVAPETAVVVSSAQTERPGGTVMVYTPDEKDLTVVWVFDEE